MSIARFLRGEIGEDLKPCEGFLVEVPNKDISRVDGRAGLWTHVVIRSRDAKWTAEQVCISCAAISPFLRTLTELDLEAEISLQRSGDSRRSTASVAMFAAQWSPITKEGINWAGLCTPSGAEIMIEAHHIQLQAQTTE